MLDFDLAEMYQIEKRTLNQAVKRNLKRFPSDFMFQLSIDEWLNLKSQFVISSWGGSRGLPYAFSEQGLAMLSGVLKSDVAIEVNISIMRVFVYLRRLVIENDPFKQIEEIKQRLEALENISEENQESFDEIYLALSQLASSKSTKNHRNPIGYTLEK